MFYDTGIISPGAGAKLFGNHNVGDRELCNLQVAGLLVPDGYFQLSHLGARVLGTHRDGELLALTHLHFDFRVGDRTQLEIAGPCVSTLLEQQPMGYELRAPIIVPVRQNISLHVRATKDMMAPVDVRCYLHGVGSVER